MKIPRKRPKKSAKSKDIVKSLSDEVGNLVICKNNGKRIKLSLKLVKEDRYRRIGIINPAQKTFTTTRSRAKHLFKKNESYGFNVKILEDAKLFDTVKLSDEQFNWKIPKSFILENGNYLNFKGQGFEKQIFIQLEQIEQFKQEPII